MYFNLGTKILEKIKATTHIKLILCFTDPKDSVTSCNIESWTLFDGALYLNYGDKDVVASVEQCQKNCNER